MVAVDFPLSRVLVVVQSRHEGQETFRVNLISDLIEMGTGQVM